mmetsp:Transcript_11158/g.32126  ORF Transcript_11158/g.32126 Transcript_11158/m.32126 type:complete len:354 (+) Transcript_11158:203-1264(+)|eukprot:CAMPEP_0119554106 /NCGR_PEP_ID=MMETSP1352-20130426/6680_1 /TAXON_ID=265584 /ORGANISM="Stauroneis constricta, Strain CCMP1120" /LENGTH=353 /DNA_ID=CAMNT_0007600633 /DNA_START=201 /DNA_END=1262 /DNA_ORIENTATION=-
MANDARSAFQKDIASLLDCGFSGMPTSFAAAGLYDRNQKYCSDSCDYCDAPDANHDEDHDDTKRNQDDLKIFTTLIRTIRARNHRHEQPASSQPEWNEEELYARLEEEERPKRKCTMGSMVDRSSVGSAADHAALRTMRPIPLKLGHHHHDHRRYRITASNNNKRNATDALEASDKNGTKNRRLRSNRDLDFLIMPPSMMMLSSSIGSNVVVDAIAAVPPPVLEQRRERPQNRNKIHKAAPAAAAVATNATAAAAVTTASSGPVPRIRLQPRSKRSVPFLCTMRLDRNDGDHGSNGHAETNAAATLASALPSSSSIEDSILQFPMLPELEDGNDDKASSQQHDKTNFMPFSVN